MRGAALCLRAALLIAVSSATMAAVAADAAPAPLPPPDHVPPEADTLLPPPSPPPLEEPAQEPAATGEPAAPAAHRRPSPVARSALLVTAGGLSGAIAKTATAPLERAKILSQVCITAGPSRLRPNLQSRGGGRR